MRDNLLMTVPAATTAAGTIFVGTGANTIAQRAVTSDTVDTAETTTSVAFTDLATVGPQCSIVTGPLALVLYAVQMSNNTAGSSVIASWGISGATSVTPDDSKSVNTDSPTAFHDIRAADVRRATGLTTGTNVFKLWYRVTGNTGTFQRRHLCVMGL